MTRPIESTAWATQSTTAGPSGNPNKTIPEAPVRDFGQAEGLPIPRQEINYILNANHVWKEYLDEEVTSVKSDILTIKDDITALEQKTTPIVMTPTTVIEPNGVYIFTSSISVKLPPTSTLPVPCIIRFLKVDSVEPLIEVDDVLSEVIHVNTVNRQDISIYYNIESEIIMIWNGSRWEI